MDRIWRDARSIGDLGGAMAGWLEGSVAVRGRDTVLWSVLDRAVNDTHDDHGTRKS